jgi:adenosylcobinamide-phosphate synthase
VHALLLYFCIGLRSLRDHTLPIHAALADGDLARARWLTSRIVSRDTENAGEAELAKAGAESLLENGNDAVFGTLFWFLVAAAPAPCCSGWRIPWMRCGAIGMNASICSAAWPRASTMR